MEVLKVLIIIAGSIIVITIFAIIVVLLICRFMDKLFDFDTDEIIEDNEFEYRRY